MDRATLPSEILAVVLIKGQLNKTNPQAKQERQEILFQQIFSPERDKSTILIKSSTFFTKGIDQTWILGWVPIARKHARAFVLYLFR